MKRRGSGTTRSNPGFIGSVYIGNPIGSPGQSCGIGEGGTSYFLPSDGTITGYGPNQPTLSGTLPDGNVGTAYSAGISATGGTAPLTWFYKNLPTPLTYNQSTGVITGTPAVAGFYNIQVTVTSNDALASTQSEMVSLAINPSGITRVTISGTYAGGTSGSAYSSSLTIAGGTGPYVNPQLVAGTLPAGLTLSVSTTNLVLSGNGLAMSSGLYRFTVSVQDSANPAQTAYIQQTIRIA